MPNIQYYLGIDGGGTKTDFALADENGVILRRVILGASNPNDVGFEKAFATLKEGIQDVCDTYPYHRISVFAGLAGCSSAENLPRIGAFLSSFGFAKADNHNDAQNAVAAALDGEDGIAVILGTGSIAYAKHGTELYRIGGYGYLFGDMGSGYAIGRDTVLAALQYEDGSGENTLLHAYVKNACGTETVLASIDLFYKEGKKEIAAYAPLAFKAYAKGDAKAQKILTENLSAIAALIKGGAKKLPGDTVRVMLCGGLTKAEDILLPLLSSLLENEQKHYDIGICRHAMVWGALRLAGMPSPKEKR